MKTTFFRLSPLLSCLALLAALFLVGCSADRPITDVAEPRGQAYADVNFSGIQNPASSREAKEQFKRDGMSRAKASLAAAAVTQQSAGWQAAHRDMQDRIASPPTGVQPRHMEQAAALMMLQKKLLVGESTSDKRESIALYTELLARHENPAAEVIQPALARLEGYWPDDRVARVAAQTAAQARAQVERFAEARGSTENAQVEMQLAQRVPEIKDEQAGRRIRTQEAVERLEAMSQRLSSQ